MIKTDLSGRWDVFLDETKRSLSPESYPDSIVLPDSISNAGLFGENSDIEHGCLMDMHKFEGYAWFRRNIEITSEMTGKCITLFLERTRMTAIYIDGRECRFGNSLCTPHRFSLGGLSEGTHELVIRVANVDYPIGGGHMTSCNWNGIIGRIELQCYDAYPEAVYAFPNISEHTLAVRAEISGVQQGKASLRVHDQGREYACAEADYANGLLESVIMLPSDVPLWDEFTPYLLKLEITIGSDSRTVTVGMREVKFDGLRLLVNDIETILHEKDEDMLYAPTDVKAWLDVFNTAKEYGINHYRFHGCCPPEAAFEAADIMGVYMQAELPFCGAVPDESSEEYSYLREEGFRILREFSHHPSFVSMMIGDKPFDVTICGE